MTVTKAAPAPCGAAFAREQGRWPLVPQPVCRPLTSRRPTPASRATGAGHAAYPKDIASTTTMHAI
ncbi:MAG TPA: hypothetical protein P5181_12935 [Dermatophilaceae bacterium]|nr:hypothetical protein [Dermatophilaceae bacterium]